MDCEHSCSGRVYAAHLSIFKHKKQNSLNHFIFSLGKSPLKKSTHVFPREHRMWQPMSCIGPTVGTLARQKG